MTVHHIHHTPEIRDMRSAYGTDSYISDHDVERLSSTHSRTGSDRSYQTAATDYSAISSRRPPLLHQNTKIEQQPHCCAGPVEESPRASVESGPSIVASEEDEDEDAYQVPDYDVQECARPSRGPRAVAATPSDFSELFPSHRRINIRHDDSTLDGNMNLRLDTQVNIHGRRCDMTLYHLRMHDLRSREFSLRRYCRDSGREVCHSARKVQKSSVDKRPGLQRSISNAISSIRSKSESRSPTMSVLKRNDSGYGSLNSSVDVEREAGPGSASSTPPKQPAVDSNLIKLEFSNYAQMDIRRRGAKGNKRYEFEYWGTSYAWRRHVRKSGDSEILSYLLTKAGSERTLAHIIPARLSRHEALEEQKLGGWVPPCTFWISDDSIVRAQKDIADVVVSSGLMALVDGAIRTHFHARDSKQLVIPKLQLGVEYVGPKRFINEIWSSRQSSKEPTSRPSSSGTGTTGSRRMAASDV